MSYPKTQNRSLVKWDKGKILQIPRMKPYLLEHGLGFKAFYCWLLKLTFSNQAIVRENI